MLCKFTANCTIGGGHKRRICAICTSVLLTALIMTFAALALPIKASAEPIVYTDGGITYTLTENGADTYSMRVSGSGNMPDYTSTVNLNPSDYTVTVTISSPYDADRENITEVVIDSGVASIGNNAFNMFKSLTSVSIPTTVKTIGDSAFSDCNSLPSVSIPTTVKTIGVSAFAGCGLASVTIPEGVETINNLAFEGCRALTTVNLPSTLKSIGNRAFSQCAALASIEIPEGVLTIDIGAFSQCSSLASVTLPSTLTSIGSAAFNNCAALTDITLPDSISSIEDYTFAHCFALDRIIYKDGVTLGENAVTDTATQVKYTTDGSAVTITEIILGMGKTAVEIPQTVNGKTVAPITDQELMKKVSHTHTGGAATCTQKAACTLCGLEYGELLPHTGGTASCTAKAVCNVCGQEYGDLAAHTLVKTGAVSPTCTAAGNDEYWTCSVCPKMFADGNGAAEITAIPTIAALPHNFVNGVCVDCGAADPNYTQPIETTVTEDTTETEPTETTPTETEPTGTVPTSPTGTSPSVPSRPSNPAPAITAAETTVTTVTTTTAEEEIIYDDYTGEDVSVDAAAYSDGKEIGGRVFGAAAVYAIIFAGLALVVKKRCSKK